MQAPSSAARAGARALFAEFSARPTSARKDGAGLLIAEACVVVGHRLHSKAGKLLRLAFQEDLLDSAELRVATKPGQDAPESEWKCYY